VDKAPEYVVIGHVSKDLLPSGDFCIGGTATYAALAAERLGLCVGILTSAEESFPFIPDGRDIAVQLQPAPATTTFENIYSDGTRRQYIRAIARPLTPAHLPPSWNQAKIIHLGPIAQEVDISLVELFPRAFLGVTPQGWLRRWDASGLVHPADWPEAEHVLARADAVVLSSEDLTGRAQLSIFIRYAKLLVLTIAEKGAIVYQNGQERHVPAYHVPVVDPTGAGDVFAAAYFVRYRETEDAIEAARFANSAASFVVEGMGASNFPSRAQVLWRMRHGRLRD